jgi:hypothetical protein
MLYKIGRKICEKITIFFKRLLNFFKKKFIFYIILLNINWAEPRPIIQAESSRVGPTGDPTCFFLGGLESS